MRSTLSLPPHFLIIYGVARTDRKTNSMLNSANFRGEDARKPSAPSVACSIESDDIGSRWSSMTTTKRSPSPSENSAPISSAILSSGRGQTLRNCGTKRRRRCFAPDRTGCERAPITANRRSKAGARSWALRRSRHRVAREPKKADCGVVAVFQDIYGNPPDLIEYAPVEYPKESLEVRDSVDDLIAELRGLDDGDGWMQGEGILQMAFMERGALDEIEICIIPELLGGGRPLFPPTGFRSSPELISAKTLDKGCVWLHYRRSF